MHPEGLASRFLEAQKALDFRCVKVIRDVHTPLRDHWPGVAVTDPCPPADLQPGGRDAVDDAGLAPDTVTFGAAPLRPISGVGVECEQQERGKRDTETELWGEHVS